MDNTTELAQPLMIVGGKVQAFSARCLEHSTTISAMLMVNVDEFREMIADSPALEAVLDHSTDFTGETLQFLKAIAVDLHTLAALVIDDHRQRRALETILANVYSRISERINHQETDRL